MLWRGYGMSRSLPSADQTHHCSSHRCKWERLLVAIRSAVYCTVLFVLYRVQYFALRWHRAAPGPAGQPVLRRARMVLRTKMMGFFTHSPLVKR